MSQPSDREPSEAEQTIRMTPEQEQAAMAGTDAQAQPADEAVGVFTDEDGDDHTPN